MPRGDGGVAASRLPVFVLPPEAGAGGGGLLLVEFNIFDRSMLIVLQVARQNDTLAHTLTNYSPL